MPLAESSGKTSVSLQCLQLCSFWNHVEVVHQAYLSLVFVFPSIALQQNSLLFSF